MSFDTLKQHGVEMYRGITTGLNDVFVIDDQTKDSIMSKDPRSADIICRTIRGRDIDPYITKSLQYWLINSHNGNKKLGLDPVKIENYPAIKAHLDKYWDSLSTRDDKGVRHII